MEIAKLILEYLRVLIWPVLILSIIFLFRKPIQNLFAEVKGIKIKEVSFQFERTLTEFIETIKTARSLEEVQLALEIFKKTKTKVLEQK